MASSFDGTAIHVELDAANGSTPWWERPTYTATRHIPGSDDDVIQVLGAGHGVVSFRLHLSGAEYTAFNAKLLADGPLIVADVAYGDAVLESISGTVRHVNGSFTLQATFRNVSAG